MTDTLPSLSAFVDFLIDVRQDLSIAHQIPGRVWFLLALSAVGRAGKHDLGLTLSDLNRVEGIEDVRFNIMARSLVIGYDTALIPDRFWEECLNRPVSDLGDLIHKTLKLRQDS